jgi:hypothetical protein
MLDNIYLKKNNRVGKYNVYIYAETYFTVNRQVMIIPVP